jgi:mRNA interferase MazF
VVIPATGSIVLVPFPFTDLSAAKLRPAVVLAQAGKDDWILCQVTSNPYGDLAAIALTASGFRSGSLRTQSFARPGKLFTAHTRLMLQEIAVLGDDDARAVLRAVISLLSAGIPL